MQLKELRKRNSLTQQELADRLSISKSYVSQLERGERQMSLDMLKKYALAVSVKPEDVMKALEVTRREAPVERDLAMQVSRVVKDVMKKQMAEKKVRANGINRSNKK